MRTAPLRLLSGLAALAFLAQSPALAAQDSALAESASARIEAAMEEQGIVGLAVALIVDGEVAHTIYRGLADRGAKIPVTAATRFRWASVSKPLTAVVALQLAAEKRLDLDGDIRSLVPEFPQKPHTISPRQLLCHQGGIVHYTNGEVVRTERTYDVPHPFADVVLALDDFKASPLIAAPGTRYAYSTRGYMLLGAVVQRAGEKPYWEQVRARIAEPLGMASLEPDYQWLDLPQRARGYRRLGKLTIPSTNTDVSWKLPGGGFLSNVEDMARFGVGLLGEDLLDAQSKARAWKRQITADGKRTGYGLGFALSKRGDAQRVGHSGAQEKTRTYLLIQPTTNDGVAIMCNTEGTRLSGLAHGLLDLAARHTPGD